MKLILCLDDNDGMMFNGRRQSRDRAIVQDIAKEADGSRLWMNEYSAEMFTAEISRGNIAKDSIDIKTDENFLDKAEQDEFCFVENFGVLETAKERKQRICGFIIYRWNRTYPYDVHFDMPLAANGWKLTETKDFEGYSHPKITKEVYTK